MDGVNLTDQPKLTYHLDQRSKFRFYLRLFLDLFDDAFVNVNSFIVYKKLKNKNLTLKEFKICIAVKLIASTRKLSCPNHHPCKRAKAQRHGPIPPPHLPIFLDTTQRCTV